MKTFHKFIAALILAFSFSYIAIGAPSVFFPYQGGTGTSTLPAAGNLLMGNSAGDGYIFVTSSSLAGSGALSSSSAISVDNFVFWANTTGGLSGTSTLTRVGTRVNNSGTISMNGDLVSSSTGANPSASVGLTAVNGTANTFTRSDGAPALSQSITPVWTGLHEFSVNGISSTRMTVASATVVGLSFTNATGTSLRVGTLNADTVIVTVLTSSTAGIFSDLVSANTLNVSSTSAFVGGVNMSSTLDLTGAARFQSTLAVTDISTLAAFTFTNATGTGNLQAATLVSTGLTTADSLNVTNGNEYRRFSKDIAWQRPTSTAGVNVAMFSVPNNLTFVHFICGVNNATATIQIDRRAQASRYSFGTMIATSTVCNSDGTDDIANSFPSISTAASGTFIAFTVSSTVGVVDGGTSTLDIHFLGIFDD